MTMKLIEQKEKHLPEKRRTLLFTLREHNWKVVAIYDDISDWALDEKWVIKSTRENLGFTLVLWLFKYDGEYDGINRVVVTYTDSTEPNAYSGEPSIEFDGGKFEKQLKSFMDSLHKFRTKR